MWIVWMLVAVLIAAAVLFLLTLFLISPSFGRKALRAPFAGRNYAHRGLFAKNQSVPENSLPAFEAAAAAGYGIELDVQFTSDRKLIVFHDDTLDRMTGIHGWVHDHPWEEVSGLSLAGTAYHPPLFSEVLHTVGGRVPLIVEIKSRQEYTGDYLDALCRATLDALKGYGGAWCIESFDPRVVGRIRKLAPGVLRGQRADCSKGYRQDGAKAHHAFAMSHCLGNFLGRPDFIAWCPEPRNWAVRLIGAMGAMMVNWTALPEHDTKQLEAEYDAVIFQWYSPAPRYRDGN